MDGKRVNQELTRTPAGRIATMRVSYSLSSETYKKLQPPFKAIEPLSRGLFFALYLVTIAMGVGFTMLTVQLDAVLSDLPPPEPGWLPSLEIFGFGAALLAGVWGFRKLSERRAVQEHGEFLRDSYGRLHCRDRRFVETTKDGVVFGCDCATDPETWADVISWWEMDEEFVVSTRRNIVSIPKGAFVTEGERTEFRATLSDHVGKDTLSQIAKLFANRGDWKRAKWLMFMGRGWVRPAALFLWAACVTVFILMALPFFGSNDAWSAPSLIGASGFTLGAAFLFDPLGRGLKANHRGRQ